MAELTETRAAPPRRLRSAGAVLGGLLTVLLLSLTADQIFHSLGVYPPWGEPMLGLGVNLLALAYRAAFTVLGGYVAARLAPSAPMDHALALGGIGVGLGTLGAIGAWGMSPAWFLIGLVLIALPCAWIGGVLYQSR